MFMLKQIRLNTVAARLYSSLQEMSEFHLAEGSQQPPLVKGLMRLYSMKYCPFAQRTRLALHFKEIPHDTVNVNLKRKPQWFLDKTPFGLVPVLELPSGDIIYESTVCNDWLNETYPSPPLYSSSSMTRAQDRIVMAHFDKISANFYGIMRGSEEKQKIFERELAFLEKALGKKKFFAGEQVGMVDFHCWPWFERLPVLKTLRSYDPFVGLPNLSRWMEDMKHVPAVQKTYIPPEEHIQFILSIMNKEPQYDFPVAAKI